MPTPVNSQHLDERLEELYRRHLMVGEDSVANYYESGRGYYKPELATEERDRFSICIVRTNGESHLAGDHDDPRSGNSAGSFVSVGSVVSASPCPEAPIPARRPAPKHSSSGTAWRNASATCLQSRTGSSSCSSRETHPKGHLPFFRPAPAGQ